MLASKTEERGLVIVHTGTGKGKSTAAFGMVMRCLGHGMRVGIVQFIKGAWDTGERHVLARFPDLVTCRAMGEGFTWDTQDRTRDIAAARAAWDAARRMIADPAYRLVLLDEPTRGMDEAARDALVGLLLRLKGEGAAIVLATHDWRLAAAVADRGYQVRGGAVTELARTGPA